jgi:hypothetical protein
VQTCAKQSTLTITTATRLSRRDADDVEAEAGRFAAFVAPGDVVIKLATPG